jgi:hypothetical protein
MVAMLENFHVIVAYYIKNSFCNFSSGFVNLKQSFDKISAKVQNYLNILHYVTNVSLISCNLFHIAQTLEKREEKNWPVTRETICVLK